MTQLPLFKPDCDSSWRPPRMDQLPSWKGARRIGIDTETRDPHLKKLGIGVRRGGYMIGISFAIEDGPAFYLPIRHGGGDNMDPDKVLQYLRDQAKEYTGDICGANLQYDLDYLAEEKVIFRQNRFRDIMIADPLIDENHRSYSLENIAHRWGFPGKSEAILREAALAWGLDPKKDMWKLPARFVGPYGTEDSVLPLKILRKQEKVIDDFDLWDIYNLECKVLPVLLKMRRRGVRIDFDQLEKVRLYTIEQEKRWLDVIFRHTNIRIGLDEINKKGPISAAFDDQGIKYGRTPTGQPQLKMDDIAKLAKTQPVAEAYCHAKYLNKIRKTFVKSVLDHQTNGRVHCTFNQLKTSKEGSDDDAGAGPGRLSCTAPNAQQQPGRLKKWWWSKDDRIDKMWRSVYIPDEGGQWAACDFCYSEDTEILTENGFVKFPKLSRDVRVAQYLEGSISYVKPIAYQIVEHSGDMYHIHGIRQIDLLVSPNHNCITTKHDGTDMRWVKPTEDLGCSRSLPQSGILAGTEKIALRTIKEAVIIQADGTLRKSHYRIFLGRQDKIDRIPSIIRRPADYICSTKAAGHAFKLAFNPLIIPGKDKIFNRKKLLELTPALRKAFLQELLYWDGSLDREIYYTTNFENAQIVQEIAILTGFRSNVIAKKKDSRKTCYSVSLNEKRSTYLKTIQKEKIQYSGTIYCVTVPQSSLIVRRNGRVAICGNSGQEPRLFVHYSRITNCTGSQDAVDYLMGGGDFHDLTTQMAFGVTKESIGLDDFEKCRKQAKAIFLGLVYGMGGAKLCRTLGFPTEWIEIRGEKREVAGPEGRRFLEDFHAKVPFLAEINQKAQGVAWNRRYIRTLLGRHIHYPHGAKTERKALNNLIQGSAADQTKLAMVQADAENLKLQLQIHDEIDMTVYSMEEANRLAEIMETCVKLTVPSKVDVEIGSSWGDSMS